MLHNHWYKNNEMSICQSLVSVIRHWTHFTMKAVLALAVFACVAAVTLADGYGYRPGFKRT